MEESKPVLTPAQTEIPDSKTDLHSNTPQNQTLPQSQPPAPAPPTPPSSILPPQSKKRPHDQNIQDSPYYKMRLIVKDLRPHFIELLKTADFQKSDSARIIQDELKNLMSLFKEMIAEPKNDKPLKDIPNGSKPKDYSNQDAKPDRTFAKPSTDRAHPTGNTIERPSSPEVTRNHVGFFVGGSAFGWNFTSYFGKSETVYCGRTKEAFRAAHAIVHDEPAAQPPQPSS